MTSTSSRFACGPLLLLLAAIFPNVQAAEIPAGTPGHIDISDEVKNILTRGTVLYYAKVYRKRYTQRDHWYVESLDIDSGNTRILMSGDEMGFSQMLPFSITKDGKYLLVSVRKPGTHRRALLEISTTTGKWRKFADDIFGGDYSPNNKLIAVYYPLDPENFYQDKRLRVGIIDRNGKFVKKIPCEGSKCFHPTWENSSNTILFIDNKTPPTLKRHNIVTKSTRAIYTPKQRKYELVYPSKCNNNIFVIEKLKKAIYSLQNKKDPNRNLVILTNNKTKVINYNLISNFSCLPKSTNYLVTITRGERKNSRPSEMQYLTIYNINNASIRRITPGPTLKTSYISPVVYVPHNVTGQITPFFSR